MCSLQDRIKKYIDKNELSDIHIHTGCVPVLRLNGDITVLEEAAISDNEMEVFSAKYLTREQLCQWRSDKCLDTDLEIDGHRLRANFYFAFGHAALALRKIAKQVPTIESLHMPTVVSEYLSEPSGLILVSGSTGSGKSTSLAAMANHILNKQSVHLLTIEDPIEFKLSARQSLVSQRQIGTDAVCFASAIRAGLREDPDIILIGEIRDKETIELALSAAELGHLVMATLHAPDCVASVERIIHSFSAQFRDHICSQLAGSLRLIVSQQLLKCTDGKGRMAVYEILAATDAVRNLIRSNNVAQLRSVIDTSKAQGMVSMHSAVTELRSAGKLI